jgi:hypothetical protein
MLTEDAEQDLQTAPTDATKPRQRPNQPGYSSRKQTEASTIYATSNCGSNCTRPLFADPERITALQNRVDARDTGRQWANGATYSPRPESTR